MNRYETSSPRTLPAIAALALATLTFALGVAVPSAPAPEHARAVLARSADKAPIEVTIVPARIDVIAVREAQPGAGEARAAADEPRARGERG